MRINQTMIILKIVFTTVFLFLVFLSFSQNKVTDTTATIVSYWKKGDKARFLFTQAKEKYKNSKLSASGGSSSIVDIYIVGADEKSYTINWKYSNIKLSNQQTDPFFSSLSKLTEGLVIRYQTNELGSFTELLNWKEIQKFVYDAMDSIANKFPSEKAALAFNKVKEVYSSKESIEQIIIRDVQLFHSMYGGEYKLREKIVAETELPNFIGGDPFPAVLSIEMTELRPKEQYCKIEMTQSIDKNKATKIISDWLEKVSEGKSKDTNISTININDFNEFEVELISGWLTRAFYKRIVESADGKNVETYELKKL
jgi:hypothetical protein